MKIINIIIIINCLINVSCSTEPQHEVKTVEKIALQPTKLPHDTIQTAVLSKISMEEALDSFGFPVQSERFDFSQGVPEFRVGLFNVLDKKEYKNKPLYIQELTWKKDSLTYVTVWYKKVNEQWKPIQYLEWLEGTVF